MSKACQQNNEDNYVPEKQNHRKKEGLRQNSLCLFMELAS